MYGRLGLAVACIFIGACAFDASGLGDGSASDTGTSSTSDFPTTRGDTSDVTTVASTTTTTTTSMTDSGSGDATGEPTGTTGADLGPFSEPELVTELNSDVDDDDPSLMADQTQIFFATFRPGGPGSEDIWVARRISADVPFGGPAPAQGLNTPANETTPVISPDGLTIRFASDRMGGAGALDIYVSTRGSIEEPVWSMPQPIAELSSDMAEGNPLQTEDALAIFLCSNRNAGEDDIFRAVRLSESDPWSMPQVVQSLSSPQRDCNAWINPDATLVFLSSHRPRGNMGGGDIWTTTGDGRAFAPAQNVSELNSIYDEDDPWLSPDLQVIHFASNRGGDWDLYRAERMP